MLAICVLIALCIAVLVCFKGEPPRIASCLLLALVVAFPAQAGPLSKVREKIGGILHRNSSSSSSTTTTTSRSSSDCPCNSTICTGQPGCPCSNGDCTCNSPTAVLKQDAPAPKRGERSVMRERLDYFVFPNSARRQPSAAGTQSPSGPKGSPGDWASDDPNDWPTPGPAIDFNKYPWMKRAVNRKPINKSAVPAVISKAPAESDEAPKTPAEKPAKTAAPTDGASLNPDENRIVVAINGFRSAHKLPAYIVDPILMRVARERIVGARMDHNHARYGYSPSHAVRDGFHADRDGSLPMVSDNLLFGGGLTPEQAVVGWEESHVGHKDNLLGIWEAKHDGKPLRIDNAFDCVGVATAGGNYIAVFGRRG